MIEQARREKKATETKIVEINCPSPIDLKSSGSLKVVVVGKKGFRIGRIDPASTRLEGVAPRDFTIEDVAVPVNARGYSKKNKPVSKIDVDGIDDLTLEFDTHEIAQALSDLNGDGMAVLELTGRLKDGTPFAGEDIVVIENGHAK